MKNFILFYHIKVEYRQQSYFYKRIAFKTRNRAGYMTDWLLVNGILMCFFLENTSTSRRPKWSCLGRDIGPAFLSRLQSSFIRFNYLPIFGSIWAVKYLHQQIINLWLVWVVLHYPRASCEAAFQRDGGIYYASTFYVLHKMIPKTDFFVYLGIH